MVPLPIAARCMVQDGNASFLQWECLQALVVSVAANIAVLCGPSVPSSCCRHLGLISPGAGERVACFVRTSL